MKLFCCYTPAHEILYRDYLLPSLPAGFTVTAVPFPATGDGDFFSPEYIACIQAKVELILRSLKENPGEIMVWSDVDIVFAETGPEELMRLLLNSGREVLFQIENPAEREVNTGFFVYRSGPQLIAFFEKVLERLKIDKTVHDQHVVNELLLSMPPGMWGRLPLSYHARSHGWPPPARLALYHANCTQGPDGLGQKIQQLDELKFLQRNRWLAIACLAPGRASRKAGRILRGCFSRRH